MSILFRLYADSDPERVASAEDNLFKVVSELLEDFHVHEKEGTPSRYATAKVPTVLQALSGISTIQEAQVSLYLLFPLL